MRHFISDPFARLVESSGGEVAVTLIVDGVMVVGFLAPVERFTRWALDAWTLAAEVGEVSVAGTAEAPTPAERVAIADAFANARGDAAPDGGQRTFPLLCVRNAEIRVGLPVHWTTVPFLLTSAERVSALTIGRPSAEDEDDEQGKYGDEDA
jgi:hypothetical protein